MLCADNYIQLSVITGCSRGESMVGDRLERTFRDAPCMAEEKSPMKSLERTKSEK